MAGKLPICAAALCNLWLIALACIHPFALHFAQDDFVLADLNGVGVPGVLTRYAVQRTCLINLLLLMAGALQNSLTINLPQNSYFMLVSGRVRRKQILEIGTELDSGDDPETGWTAGRPRPS